MVSDFSLKWFWVYFLRFNYSDISITDNVQNWHVFLYLPQHLEKKLSVSANKQLKWVRRVKRASDWHHEVIEGFQSLWNPSTQVDSDHKACKSRAEGQNGNVQCWSNSGSAEMFRCWCTAPVSPSGSVTLLSCCEKFLSNPSIRVEIVHIVRISTGSVLDAWHQRVVSSIPDHGAGCSELSWSIRSWQSYQSLLNPSISTVLAARFRR